MNHTPDLLNDAQLLEMFAHKTIDNDRQPHPSKLKEINIITTEILRRLSAARPADPNPLTFRDMMAVQCPGALSNRSMGGVTGCPGNYFEGAPVLYERDCGNATPDRCAACWNSPLKEVTP